MSNLPNNPIDSIHDVLAFDARDWSQNKADAWLYGIVCGWGDSLPAVATKHRWTQNDMTRLIGLRRQWLALRRTAKGGGR